MLLQQLISEKFLAKRTSDLTDKDREALRQRAIKAILNNYNGGHISIETANRQLKDKNHPGISEDVIDEASDVGKAEHKARLDKMDPKALLAHITKHAGEAKLPGEKTSAGDIKGHAMRDAARLGHSDNSFYWNRIKHLVKEDEVTEGQGRAEKVLYIIDRIGKKYKVDFNDADGKAAWNAMKECYKAGFNDGQG